MSESPPSHTLATNLAAPPAQKRKRPPPRLFARPKKRRPAPCDAVEDVDEGVQLSDTEIALRTLQSTWPNEARQQFVNTPPLLLRTQLEALLADVASLQQELDRLTATGNLIGLRLPRGVEAYVFREDLEKVCTSGMRKRFLEQVVSKCEIIVAKELLEEWEEDQVTVLVKEGFLTMRDETSFWLAVPGIGDMLRIRELGNRELVSVVRRAKYNEVPIANVEARTLKKSCFTAVWHLRDLVGQSKLQTVDTTIGTLVRLHDPRN